MKMVEYTISNSRSALRLICSIPADCSVIEAARRLSILILKKTNTQQQLEFLKLCRKENIYPKNISTLKLPNLYQSFASRFDTNGKLQHLQPSIIPMYLKQRGKIQRMTSTIHKFFLKAEIDEKYLEIKWCDLEIESIRKTLGEVATPRESRYINKIIEDHRAREKEEAWQKLDRKLENIRNAIQNPDIKQKQLQNESPDRSSSPPNSDRTSKDVSTNMQVATEPSSSSGNTISSDSSAVIVTVPSIYDNKASNILQRGRNYKLSPENGSRLENDFQTGVWRMIAAMRYSNPAYGTYLPNSVSHMNKNPASAVMGFDKDLCPPPRATREIESTIKELKGAMEPLKQEMRKIHIPRNYLKEDLESLAETKKKDNVQIILTDKTNGIAVMDRELVQTKIADHLRAPAYQLLEEDPTKSYETAANNLFADICADLNRDPSTPPTKHLMSQHSTAPELYPMAKDHKPTFPDTKVRVVQPINNSAIEKMDMVVSKILIQINQLLPNRVKSTKEFITKLHNTYPENIAVGNHINFQASLDVENMYPTLPTDERALEVISRYIEEYKSRIDLYGFLPSHITSMLQFVLHHTYIKAGEHYYLQKRGIGTGSHSSGAYAEILVDYTYKTAAANSTYQPECLSTYVDDAWLLWTSSMEHFEEFKTALNSVWDTVNFTSELPEEGKLNFLDLTIEIRDNREISYTHYQKPTASGRYLHYESHCSLVTKTNIIRSETRRIVSNCKYQADSWEHLEKLKLHLIQNSGYPEETVTRHMLQALEKKGSNTTTKPRPNLDYILKIPYINEGFTRKVNTTIKKLGISARVVTQAGRSVRSLINSPKEASCQCELCMADIDCSTRHYVYKAKCTKCGDLYVGASRRPIKGRISEHESSFRLNNGRTSLGQHAAEHRRMDNPKYKPKAGKRDFETFFKHFEFSIEERCKDTLDTFIREGLAIDRIKPKINNMCGNGFTE